MRREVLSLKEQHSVPAPSTPALADPRPATETPFDVSATIDFDAHVDSKLVDEQSKAENSPGFGESRVDKRPEAPSPDLITHLDEPKAKSFRPEASCSPAALPEKI
eukprot:6868911-Karenia_brevis.AAC.1